MSKQILPSEYLYGIKLMGLRHQSYALVLFTKIKLAKALLYKLVVLDENKDKIRVKKVSEAIEFNTQLLLELGYTLPEISLIVSEKDIPEYKNPKKEITLE